MDQPDDVAECDEQATQVHVAAMRLFREKALTISKSGKSVSIHCDSDDDADVVFAWLTSITGRYGSVDEWLDEMESFSSRRERLDHPRVIESWIRTAFALGGGRDE